MSSQIDDTATGVSSPWPTRTGVNRTELDPTSFLHRSATIHPDRDAVVYGDLRRTYAELHERVNRLGSALHARGLEHHHRVAALCPNVPEILSLKMRSETSGSCEAASCGSLRVKLERSERPG
jgi:non-ribosomal peptide synthetase component F